MIDGNTVRARPYRNVTMAAVIGLAAVLPFVLLEVINRRGYGEGFPAVMFFTLWLFSFGFIYTLIPVTKSLISGQPAGGSRAGLLGRLTLLIVAGWLWATLVSDQMPCFLGVPNCD